MDLCKKCDVYVGFDGAGVAKQPKDRSTDWLKDHCWICGRHRADIRADQLSPNHPAMGNLSQEEFDESGYDGPMSRTED